MNSPIHNSTDLDPKLRALVLYQDAEWAVSKIAWKLKISERTIRDWISKIKEGINIMEVQPGRGKKRTISEDVKRKIVRTSGRKPATSSLRNLGAQYNVGKDSASRFLKEKGYKYQKVPKEVELTEKEKNDRVKYCKNMLKRKGKPLEEIFFSDEMGMHLSDALPDKAWIGPRKKIKVEKPRKDVKVNCWGGISFNGATSLHIYKTTLKHDNYQNIMEEHKPEMDELYPNGFQFMHDNLSPHVKAEPNLKLHGLNIIEFPTYSPDLNPLENLWKSLKDRVTRDQPKTEKQLIRSLENNWETLTERENLRPYFENLSVRYKECIDLKGIRLKH